MSACTLWTHRRQQKALPSVEWLLARAGDGGPPTFKRHWGGMSVYTMWTHSRQHKALPRAECMMASTGDAGPTFSRHWVSVGLYSVDTGCILLQTLTFCFTVMFYLFSTVGLYAMYITDIKVNDDYKSNLIELRFSTHY